MEAENYIRRAKVYHSRGQYKKAIEDFERAVQADPRNLSFQAWFGMGKTYLALEDYEKAIESYQEVVKFKSKHTAAWINMGVAYYKLGKYKNAIECYQKAARSDS